MKVSKLQADSNREAIAQAASARIRDHGFSQMGVADVAKAAGLTHGALYNHFKSREALQAHAVERAFAECRAAFEGMEADAFLDTYLSTEHRDHAGKGCPASALVTEVRWQSETAKAAFATGLNRFITLTMGCLRQDGSACGQQRAILTVAAMVGGMAMARAVRDVDQAASENILRALDEQLRALVASWAEDRCQKEAVADV